MKDAKTLTIEVTEPNPNREAWWNNCVGERFEVREWNDSSYMLTQKSLDKMMMVAATIPIGFTVLAGEKVVKEMMNPIMVHHKQIRFLQEVRVFTVNKDFHQRNRQGNITFSFWLEGDVFEEVYDKPNLLIRIKNRAGEYYEGNEMKGWDVAYINESPLFLSSFQLEDTIPVKESRHFELNRDKLVSQYTKTRNAIARANEKLTNLEFLLDIEREEEDE